MFDSICIFYKRCFERGQVSNLRTVQTRIQINCVKGEFRKYQLRCLGLDGNHEIGVSVVIYRWKRYFKDLFSWTAIPQILLKGIIRKCVSRKKRNYSFTLWNEVYIFFCMQITVFLYHHLKKHCNKCYHTLTRWCGYKKERQDSCVEMRGAHW